MRTENFFSPDPAIFTWTIHNNIFSLFQYPVQGPYRTRLCTYLQGDFQQLFLAMLDNVHYIHSLQDDGIGK